MSPTVALETADETQHQPTCRQDGWGVRQAILMTETARTIAEAVTLGVESNAAFLNLKGGDVQCQGGAMRVAVNMRKTSLAIA